MLRFAVADHPPFYEQALAALEAADLRRRLTTRSDQLIDFSSNDYLGLADHPQVLAAATNALAEARRVGAGAARLIGANASAHLALESELARFKGSEAALLFSSGYQANVGVIPALVETTDVIYSDALNHASLIDGCRLSGATKRIYQHNDVDQLTELLTADQGKYRRRLIVSDSVFGMDGDCAPLGELAELARRFDALLYVDEAHATGVHGPRGAGRVAAEQITVDLQLTTFGKALGTFGAAVSGRQTLIEYLVNRARSFVFTTALPPHLCAAASQAITLCASSTGDALRQQLARNVAELNRALDRPQDTPFSPIIPIQVGTPRHALDASAGLAARGFFVQAIRPPTVPANTSRLRVALSARHTLGQIQSLAAALTELIRT